MCQNLHLSFRRFKLLCEVHGKDEKLLAKEMGIDDAIFEHWIGEGCLPPKLNQVAIDYFGGDPYDTCGVPVSQETIEKKLESFF